MCVCVCVQTTDGLKRRLEVCFRVGLDIWLGGRSVLRAGWTDRGGNDTGDWKKQV